MSIDTIARLSDECLERILWYGEESAEALFLTGSKAIQELLSRTWIESLDVDDRSLLANAALLGCFKKIHRLYIPSSLTVDDMVFVSHSGILELVLTTGSSCCGGKWPLRQFFPSIARLQICMASQAALEAHLSQQLPNDLASIELLDCMYARPNQLRLPTTITRLRLSTIRVSEWEQQRTNLNEIIHHLSVVQCPNLASLTLEFGLDRSLENHANVKLESSRLEYLRLKFSFLHDFEPTDDDDIDETDDFYDLSEQESQEELMGMDTDEHGLGVGNQDGIETMQFKAHESPSSGSSLRDIVKMPNLGPDAHAFIRNSQHSVLKSLRLDVSFFNLCGSFPSGLTSLKITGAADSYLKRQKVSEWPSTLLTLVVRGVSSQNSEIFSCLPPSLTHLELPIRFVDWVQLPPLLERLVSDPASRFMARTLSVPPLLALPASLRVLDCPHLLLCEASMRNLPQKLRYLRYGRRDERCPPHETVEASLPRTRVTAVNVNILW